MDLKQLIEYLEKKDGDIVVPVGFDEPHSYRGDYMCLAFEPAKDVTIGAMLQCAKDAVGNIYQGWKGGEYRMDDDTEVYLATYGCSGEKIGIVLLDYMTGVYEGEECESLRGVISRSTDEIAGLIADRDHVRTDLKSADSKLFEYRKQIVEQSKAIHDLTVEKAQVGRAIEAMTGTISEQNQILLHINAEIEFIKQHPFDLVLIDGSIENISNVIKDHKKSFINEEHIECARLKKELDAKTEIIKQQSNTIEDLNSRCDSLEKDREFERIISDSYRDDIEDLKDSIRGLEAKLASAARSLLDSSPMIFERDRIIENKIATINWLEARIDNQMKRLQSRSEEITSLKAKLVIRNVPAMEESLKSSSRLALRQDDEIKNLKAKVDRLCGIIRSERAYNADHVYNADLLEGNKLKFHKIAVLEAELAALKADSEVLTKVVNVIRDWGGDEDDCRVHINTIRRVYGIVEDYIDIPRIVVIK